MHDCPIVDTGADGVEPGIVIAEAPAQALVLAWSCAEPWVDCVDAVTGIDGRGLWRASCGDSSRRCSSTADYHT